VPAGHPNAIQKRGSSLDAFERVLSVLQGVPYSLCTCCLVESVGLRPHAYVRSVCLQLRQDGKIRTPEPDLKYAVDRRHREHRIRCGVCRSSYPEWEIFEAAAHAEKASQTNLSSVPSDIGWAEEHLADRICKAIAGTGFESVGVQWLNAERTKIIRILNRFEKGQSSEALSYRVTVLRKEKRLPDKIANYMQALLALRNSATYDDRRLDPAETVIARVAANEIAMWGSSED
jgi:hypothetical protein